jgi:hypothetical protein
MAGAVPARAAARSWAVTPAASLAFLGRSVVGCASPAHPPDTIGSRRPGWIAYLARSGLRPRGWVASGVVARSEVDARLAVVQMRPGDMAPSGPGTRQPAARYRPIAHIDPLHLLAGWWRASCTGCGYELAEGKRQDRVERKAARRTCPVCQDSA